MEMLEQFIAGGAILQAGERATLTRATLHAQILDAACRPQAALVDFESPSEDRVRALLAVGALVPAPLFEERISPALLERGDCSFEDVVLILARCLDVRAVHLFARWQPAPEVLERLSHQGVTLDCRPLETLGRVALVRERKLRSFTVSTAA